MRAISEPVFAKVQVFWTSLPSLRPRVFIHVSTNKVYGDAPNEMELVETDTRWEYARPEDWNGVWNAVARRT